MPLDALVLVLIAALLHAVWHLFSKSAQDTSAFMWWGITVGVGWFGLLVATQSSLLLPAEAWPVYLLSMVAELGYLLAIIRAYADGDLSQVYPIARGTPPLLIALWSALFLTERLPLPGYAGIGLVALGVYLASLPALRDCAQPLKALSNRSAQWALLAAVCVSVYTTLDKIGVAFTTPYVYNWWVFAGISVGYAPIVWSPANRASTLREWRASWRRVLVGSVATIGSYLLALAALSMTAASYVGAVRATSVVIGAAFGWLLLKEQLGPLRVFAAAVMAGGLALLALAQ